MHHVTRLARLAAIVALLFTLHPGARAQETRDPKAAEIADQIMAAMGGADAFNTVRYVRFDFKVGQDGDWRVDRSHLWDKWTGRYRFERLLDDGQRAVVLFNVNDKQGDFYLDGEKVEGDTAAEALDRAYRGFVNDSYWLAMPWKWLDPGVNIKYAGEEEHNGEVCDVVELSFNAVGLTPGDVYRGYVSRTSMWSPRERLAEGDYVGAKAVFVEWDPIASSTGRPSPDFRLKIGAGLPHSRDFASAA